MSLPPFGVAQPLPHRSTSANMKYSAVLVAAASIVYAQQAVSVGFCFDFGQSKSHALTRSGSSAEASTGVCLCIIPPVLFVFISSPFSRRDFVRFWNGLYQVQRLCVHP